MKRGTHGIAGISIVVAMSARWIEKVYISGIVVIAGTQPGAWCERQPQKRGFPRLYQKKFTTIELKRGTHGIAVVSVTVVIAARWIEKVCIVSIVVIAGTQPGTWCERQPQKRGISAALSKKIYHNWVEARDARHGGDWNSYSRDRRQDRECALRK